MRHLRSEKVLHYGIENKIAPRQNLNFEFKSKIRGTVSVAVQAWCHVFAMPGYTSEITFTEENMMSTSEDLDEALKAFLRLFQDNAVKLHSYSFIICCSFAMRTLYCSLYHMTS
jgi:hypothetical protein